MADKIIYQSGGWSVSNKILSTPKATHRLNKIQSISARRTLLPILAIPSIGFLLFAFSFYRYLYQNELIILISVSIVLVVVSTQVGTLKINSVAHAQNSDFSTAYGFMWTLNKVKVAVIQALVENEEREDKILDAQPVRYIVADAEDITD